MAVIVNGDGILTGISSLATDLTDITSGRGTVTGVATVGTLQLGAGVSISSPRTQNAAIFTNNTEFLTVDDAGRVGVGTVTPNSDAHPENNNKINVGFITAKSIAGDIDARNMVIAGVTTVAGSLDVNSTTDFGNNIIVSNGNLQLNSGSIVMSTAGNITLGDSGSASSNRLVFGAGTDLSIYHDTSAGQNIFQFAAITRFRTNSLFSFQNSDGSEAILKGTPDASTELFYNGLRKLRTVSDGVEVNSANAGDACLALIADQGDDNADYFRLKAANSGGLYIQNYAAGSWENNILCNGNGNVSLYHDNSLKFETTSTGAKISGSTTAFLEIATTNGDYNPMVRQTNGDQTFDTGLRGDSSDNWCIYDVTNSDNRFMLDPSGNVRIPNDSVELSVGAGNDLVLKHTGSESIIETKSSATKPLHIKGDPIHFFKTGTSEYMCKMTADSSVQLYHDGDKVFETTSYGIKVDNASDAIMEMHTSNATAHSRINFSNNNGDNTGGIWYSASNHMQFRTASDYQFVISATNGRLERSFGAGSSTDADGMWFNNDQTATGVFIRFWQTSGGYGANQVGSISHSANNTAYNTSSDYRLKENVVAISDGITRLKTLKPYRFNFKSEPGKTVDGFFAHEAAIAVPEAVTGTKDEVATIDDESSGQKKGDPIHQGMDYGKITPLLTAALQEAIAKIETLEAKVAALEAG